MVRRDGGPADSAQPATAASRGPYHHGGDRRGLNVGTSLTAYVRTPSPRLLVVGALTVAFAVLGLETIPPADTPTELWATLAASFVWTTVVWDGRSRPDPSVALHLLAQLAIFLATATAFGWALSDSLWMGVTNVGGGVLMAVLYVALGKGGAGWAPASAWSNVALLLSALAAGALVALLAGYPHLELGQLDRLAVWWTVRNLAYAYIGGVTMLGIFFGERQPGATPAPRWAVVLLVPLGAACVAITYSDPELPLTWFLLLPAVVAGSILTPRGAAGYSLFVALLTALAALHPINQFGYEGLVPGSIIIDLLLTASTFMTLHLAILRAQRAEATGELERQRRSAHEQAALLSTVFETMTDGLVVQDAQRRVLLHNHAARHLVGRRIPLGQEMDWVDYLGLRRLDGEPPTEDDLPGGGDPDRFVSHLVVENEGAARVLEVGAWPLPGDGERTMVLFSDVTAERERLTELTGFAGVVAHDLRGPLASLHGWLELAEDAFAGPDPHAAAEFVSRAQVSSRRMRHVIEDWLAYTVQRDGLLTIGRVSLGPLVEDVVAPYQSADSAVTPRFELRVDHCVEADRVLTRQLLANLIGNAVKYSPQDERPHVTVRS